MKGFTLLSALVGAAFVGLTNAQISQCIITCSTQAANAAGCGTYTNTTCVCTSATFQNDAGACLLANCSTADQQSASALQQALCQGQSVTGGSVTATIATATGSTQLPVGSVTGSASGASASVSGASMSASSVASVASSGASGVSASASSVASAAASVTGKSGAGQVAAVGIKGLVGMGAGVIGAVAGAVMLL